MKGATDKGNVIRLRLAVLKGQEGSRHSLGQTVSSYVEGGQNKFLAESAREWREVSTSGTSKGNFRYNGGLAVLGSRALRNRGEWTQSTSRRI